MSKTFLKKNLKLSLEFDNYAARHPQIYDKIPNGSWLMLTVAGDTDFNRESRSLVRDSRIRQNKIVEARKQHGRWLIKKPALVS